MNNIYKRYINPKQNEKICRENKEIKRNKIITTWEMGGLIKKRWIKSKNKL